MQNSMTERGCTPEQGLPEVKVSVTDRALLELIRVGAIIRERICSFEPALKYVEDGIASAALEYLEDDGEVVFTTPEGRRAHVSVEYAFGEIPPENVPALRAHLGGWFNDLVEISVRPTPALIAMACDGDRGMEIRKHLSIRRKAPVVKIVAEDPTEVGAGT